jgi:tetratricopeptide (TPR) repeat protein
MPAQSLKQPYSSYFQRDSRRLAWHGGAICLVFMFAALASRPQQAPAQPAQPSQSGQPSSDSPTPGKATPGTAAPATAPYNPLPAENDVEVATYYNRKGDPDAAIPRLEEAIQLKPDYAKPREMLAEIYEKKGDKENALKYYRDYLQVFPHAPDAKKIESKIAKLSKS